MHFTGNLVLGKKTFCRLMYSKLKLIQRRDCRRSCVVFKTWTPLQTNSIILCLHSCQNRRFRSRPFSVNRRRRRQLRRGSFKSSLFRTLQRNLCVLLCFYVLCCRITRRMLPLKLINSFVLARVCFAPCLVKLSFTCLLKIYFSSLF